MIAHDSKLFYRERTQSCISIWRKDSKSYLQFAFQHVWRKVSKSYLQIIYFSTPCRSKVTSILWYVDPLQKQGHICFFSAWSLAEARSWPFLTFMLCSKGFQVVSTLYFSARVGERSQSRIFTPYFFCSCDSKSYPHFTFLFVYEKTQSHIHTLLFSSCVRKNSKLNLCTLFFNNFTSWYLEKGLKV